MKYKKELLTLSIAVISLGALVIAGWIFNIAVFKSVFPGYVTMKLNTALCFIISGVLFNQYINRKYAVIYHTLSISLILFACASLFEDFCDRNIGIDQLFVSDSGLTTLVNLHPGRMSTTTALSFTCLGLVFLFLFNKPLKATGQYILHIISLLAFIAIVGYFFNVPVLYKLSFFSSMALHTAIALFFLSIALSMVNPSLGITGLFSGNKIGNRMARRMFPKMIIAVFVLGFLRIEAYRFNLIGTEFGIALFATAFILVGLALIWDTALLLNKIDNKREQAENGLVLINTNLEKIIDQRTFELNESITNSKAAEANLRAVFDSAQVSIVEADMNGIITNFNRGAEILTGYQSGEVVGKQSPVFMHVEKEIVDRGNELSALFGKEIKGNDVFIEYAKKGKHESRQWTYVRKDGSTFPVQLVVSPITDDQGETTGFLGVATDISDLENAKSDLEILTTHLQKQNNQLLNFARITSHNLRSPVSNLNTILYLYKETEGEEEKQTLFDHFETVINHLTETLNQLVESLKVQEDPSKEREWITFEEVFNKTKEILAGTIIETHAIVTSDFSKSEKIEYPKSYLESIMLNLFSNAMKYSSPNRTPEIHFQTEGSHSQTTLKISDNGLGMDLTKDGKNLFGLNKTFHNHTEARGVGLYMTKIQIEAMGGYITAESQVDKGTTFKVFFDKNEKNS